MPFITFDKRNVFVLKFIGTIFENKHEKFYTFISIKIMKIKMKKNIATVVLSLISTIAFSQSAIDQIENIQGVNCVLVNKKMFDLMSKVKVDASDKDTQQYMNLIKKIDNLKVFRTQNAKTASQMKLSAEKYIATEKLNEVVNKTENGKKVTINVKNGATENQISELVMYVDGAKNEDTVLMFVTGNFSMDELPVLTEKMKIPGGNELKNATGK